MIKKLNSVELICKKAKSASYELAVSSNKERNIALKLIANQILKSIDKITIANKKGESKLPLSLIPFGI